MRLNAWRFRLEHILESIRRIQEYTEGLTFEEFRDNRLVVDATLNNLGIIGEAARHVPQQFKDQYPEVPWRQMNSMRNFVVHQYFRVELDIIWNTVQNNLPPIASVLRSIMESDENAE